MGGPAEDENAIGFRLLGDDIGKAKAAIEDVLSSEERVLQEPPILVNVTLPGDSAVVLLARCNVRAADFFATKLDLTRAIKERLDRENISIPFPQRDLHMITGKAS